MQREDERPVHLVDRGVDDDFNAPNTIDALDPEHRMTHRERLFVEAYLGPAHGVATKAARMAGYEGDGDTLKVTAHRVLTRANVQFAISRWFRGRKLDTDWLLASLGEIANGNMSDFLSTYGKYTTIDLDKAAETGALVLLREFSEDIDDAGVLKRRVKLYDKLKAIEIGLRALGVIQEGSAGQDDKSKALDVMGVTTPEQVAEYCKLKGKPVPAWVQQQLAAKAAAAVSQEEQQGA